MAWTATRMAGWWEGRGVRAVIVAFDFDDVLVDFVQAWLDAFNEVNSTSWTREDIRLKGWDMSAWANEQVKDGDWLEFLRDRLEYWVNAETEPGALECLERLHGDGHRIELVTNKPAWARTVVWRWMDRYNPPIEKVVIANHFGKAKLSDATILVDDRPETLTDWEQSNSERTGILYARSQNRHARDKFVVAGNMDGVYDIVTIMDKIRRTKPNAR